jgi:hypothetical protein
MRSEGTAGSGRSQFSNEITGAADSYVTGERICRIGYNSAGQIVGRFRLTKVPDDRSIAF